MVSWVTAVTYSGSCLGIARVMPSCASSLLSTRTTVRPLNVALSTNADDWSSSDSRPLSW